MYGLFCIVSSNLFFSDSMVLFLVLAHCFILCELATIYPMWFCLISSQGLLSIYTPWLPLWHVVTQHLEYSIRFNKEYYSIYQTTIYMYWGTGLEYHPWGFGGVLNCSPGTYKMSCSAINWSSCFLFVIYPPSCPSSSSSFFTNAILLLMSSRTLLWHLAPSMSKGVQKNCFFEHYLNMCYPCFLRVLSLFLPSFPTSTVSRSADGCCLALRRQLCASGHARPQNLCQSTGPQRRGVMGYGCRLTMWLWCHYDMYCL